MKRLDWIMLGAFAIFMASGVTAYKQGYESGFRDGSKPVPTINEDIQEVRALVNTPPDTFLAGVAHDKERSGKWRALRKKVINDHPFCAYCGGTDYLQAHHIRPFHLHPELELEPSNVIVLCEVPGSDHHLYIGHAANFKAENENVVLDCQKHEAEMRAAGTWPRK